MLNIKEEGSENFVHAPIKSLPVTGVPVAGIRKYAELPCRAQAERDLFTFISSCLNAEKIYGCVIKAWWGEGKTDAYENFIKPMLEEKKILTYDVIATTIARVLEKRQKEGVSDSVVWIAFLASLFDAVWEERKLDGEAELFRRSDEEIKSDPQYITRVVKQLMKKSSKIFFFIDELEQLERLSVREDFLLGVRGLFDQDKEILRGNIHLLLACTPDAFNRIVGSSAQMGGLLERLTLIDLPRPSIEEAVKFVYGLIDYIYEGKLPEQHPFINTGPAYAIIYAGHRSPRSMIKTLQHVIEYAKHQASESGKEGYLKRIDGWDIINALKNYNLPIFGTQALALDGDILQKVTNVLSVKNDEEKTNLLNKLIQLLIGEPVPHSLKELSQRLNISEHRIKEYIGIANNKAEETKLLNGFLILHLAESSKPIEDISEDLKNYFISFVFTNNSRIFKMKTFLPLNYRILMNICPELDLNSAQRISRKISPYSTGEDYYLISPELIQHIYPNPEFLELDFIKDKNIRLELWKKAYEMINERGALSLCEESLLDALKSLKSPGRRI
ncbi:MAG: hypothetical protein QXK24_01840 [Ignisphaera sp.]